MVRILNKGHTQIKRLLSTLDHVDEEKVTWGEFMNWMTKEGILRNIANDQRLFTFTVTRLYEGI